MTQEATAIRLWIARAKTLHEKRTPYEEAAENLNGVCGADEIITERNRLRALEAVARMELYESLKTVTLTPRQFTVLNLHYLQYLSWTQIAETLHIERRYALQIHTQALERLVGQINENCPVAV